MLFSPLDPKTGSVMEKNSDPGGDPGSWMNIMDLIFENLCWAIYYPATSPSKLLDGNQGHPLFLPAAWDCPVTTEPGSKTVYTRHCLFSKHL
jgi:hypothetical protein